MTEADIQRLLATTLFHYRRHVCVPNVDWGFLPYEADLVVLHASGWADEIEIKTSAADLRRDKKKYRHRAGTHLTHRIRKRYYCAPVKVLQAVDLRDVLTNGEGLIAVEGVVYPGCIARILKPAKSSPACRKLTDAEKFKLARLGCIRFWTKSP